MKDEVLYRKFISPDSASGDSLTLWQHGNAIFLSLSMGAKQALLDVWFDEDMHYRKSEAVEYAVNVGRRMKEAFAECPDGSGVRLIAKECQLKMVTISTAVASKGP